MKSNYAPPVGSFIKTEKGYFFVESNVKRFRFTSTRALESWTPPRILEVSESNPAVQAMKITAKMKYRNGSLIWNISDGRVYLIEKGKRRWVRNPDYLEFLEVKTRNLFFKSDSGKHIVCVSQLDIQLHEPGEDII